MKLRRVLIVDGYNDEPGGLGVPPYIDVYPRLVAGSIWLARKDARVDYITVDEFRVSRVWLRRALQYDAVVFVAGVVVPGKYLAATPATHEELVLWGRMLSDVVRILVGPAAKWGLGYEGGKPAVPPQSFKRAGYLLVTGDPEIFFYEAALEGLERARPYAVRSTYQLADKALILGSRIIRQHPNYGRNLIAEIETYRGCARWVTGGCSFCVEPLRGRPIQRDPKAIVQEVEALYRNGARALRLGRQADILVYGSPELGEKEWPRPNPQAMRALLEGIRAVAPRLDVLHIDNVNPGTIVRHVDESIKVLKIIVEYHTDGDVAAMGVETADPRVAKINNLNTTADEALEAIRMVNRIGSRRGPRGLPHLLPGINFLLGLPGESRETYRLNREFLERILDEGLMIRRVNIRKVMVIPHTRLSRMWKGFNRRLEAAANSFISWVRRVFDREMLRRVVPPGTRLLNLWVESCEESYCYARAPGSYPIAVFIPCRLPKGVRLSEVVVKGVHSSRAVRGTPRPNHYEAFELEGALKGCGA